MLTVHGRIDRQLIAVPIRFTNPLQVGAALRLFDTPIGRGDLSLWLSDVPATLRDMHC